MTDTIFVILNDTIAQTDPTILSEVEAYYNNALTRILGIIGIVVAIMAIAFPLYIFIWQRLTFRHEIIKQTEKFKEEIQKDYEMKILNMDFEIEIGAAFSIALHARNEGQWVMALRNFFLSLDRSLRINKYPSFKSVLSHILAIITLKEIEIYKEHLDDAVREIKTKGEPSLLTIEEYIQKLRQLDLST